MNKTIKTALISVFHKEGIDKLVELLHKHGCKIISTGGTAGYIKKLGIPVTEVADITSYPSIFDGRVKTLHPKIFGGILNRDESVSDQKDVATYEIPNIDLVMVDLYPFEETLKSGSVHEEVIEKIDIGGISLIRAAAKNYQDVLCVSHKEQYQEVFELLKENKLRTELKNRKQFAAAAFAISSHYDTRIYNYLQTDDEIIFRESYTKSKSLRYGENPHQKGYFFGDFEDIFEQLHGKSISYNNLLDIDAAVNLMQEFSSDIPTFAILKHNNACGVAQRNNLLQAYKDALAGDPVSAFGGILISNTEIDKDTAEEVNKLFCEVVIAPGFEQEALDLLKSKKNRILLLQKKSIDNKNTYRNALNGVLYQERDFITDNKDLLNTVTKKKATADQIEDLIFASIISKHTRSNTIVLAKNKQLIASGIGQTSRVDALEQAIAKAKHFSFDLNGVVLASDAFFPFPDIVEIAHKEGINTIIQPGGSIRDNLSIEYCDANDMSMLFTGVRHFKH